MGPDEMVRYIELAIPPGMEDVFNPIGDAELMARIGAKRSSSVLLDKVDVGSIYELKNASATKTTYKMWWWRTGSQQYCRIERGK